MSFISDFRLSVLCDASFNMRDEYQALCHQFWKDNPYSPMPMINIDNPEQVDGNAVEIKLDSFFKFFNATDTKFSYNKDGMLSSDGGDITFEAGETIDFRNLIKGKVNIDDITVYMPPRSMILCQSREFVQIPPDLIGFVYVRSSYARSGITHLTAQILKSTFCGHVTFELYNTKDSYEPINLGDPVIQLLFSESHIPAKPYFIKNTSRYQNQHKQLTKLEVE